MPLYALESAETKQQHTADIDVTVEQETGEETGKKSTFQGLRGDPNFPPCYPLVRHSIPDLENKFKKLICVMALVVYFIHSALAVLAFIVALINLLFVLITSKDFSSWWLLALLTFVWAILQIVVGFVCQYFLFYLALATGNSLGYVLFFISYFISALFCIFQTTGIYPIGANGWVIAIVWASEKEVLSQFVKFVLMLMNVIVALGFTILFVYYTGMLIAVWFGAFSKDNPNIAGWFKALLERIANRNKGEDNTDARSESEADTM